MRFAGRALPILVACELALCLPACRGVVETPLPFAGERVRAAGRATRAASARHPQGLKVARSLVHVVDADHPDRPAFECALSLTNATGLPLSFDYASFSISTDDGRRLALDRALAWRPAADAYEPAPERVGNGETLELSLRFPAHPRVILAHLLRLRLSWGYRLGRREYHVESVFRVGF